jgi:hypothetical protein
MIGGRLVKFWSSSFLIDALKGQMYTRMQFYCRTVSAVDHSAGINVNAAFNNLALLTEPPTRPRAARWLARKC